MKRDQLKSVIKKLVLREITQNQFGTPNVTKDPEGEAVVKKFAGKDGEVSGPVGTGKVVADSSKHHVELVLNGGLYDVVSVTNGSDRRTAKSLKLEDAKEFIEKHAKDSEKSYTEKAYDKSEKGFGKQAPKEAKKEEKNADEMKDVKKPETQTKIADKNDAKAEEKPNKDLAPTDDDNSAAQGGQLVDKISRIIDTVLKNKAKADSKTAYLKADKDMESPDKLAVKLDGTNAIKGAKSKEKITPKVKAVDSKK